MLPVWYYSRRYVGDMSLMMPNAQRVRFSVLDFWGNREVREGLVGVLHWDVMFAACCDA